MTSLSVRIRTLAHRLRTFPARRRAIAQLAPTIPDARSAEEKVHALLDEIGVAREEAGTPLSADSRLMIVLTRFHDVVAANQQLGRTIRDARTLLVGAPNAGSLRVRRAIDLLQAAPAAPSPTQSQGLPS